MNSINVRIIYYQNKLARLNAKLEILRVKGAFSRKHAINLILEIDRIEMLLEKLEHAARVLAFAEETKPRYIELTLDTPKNRYRAWVAMVLPEYDKCNGGLKKRFIKAIDRKFNYRGETKATFKIKIELDKIYKDSDGDYWQFKNLDGDIKCISWQEVKYLMFEKDNQPKQDQKHEVCF